MGEEEFKGENTRQFYRINYPDAVRPRLRTEKGSFLIKSLSEHGAELIIEDHRLVEPKEAIYGDVTFHDGATSFVEGKVLRSLGDSFILHFTVGVPLKTIVNEQRYLMDQYRHVDTE
ncbi:MAG: PilZ domain-containing protein [Proteobacteria bacterium]|nr:PilZ domain-containing protein [Pseudomonadota bacterium]